MSPRPHDTGLVTLLSQDLSEFALHARAILDLPIPAIRQLGACASQALVFQGQSNQPKFAGLDKALNNENVQLRLFGKPEIHGIRRMGVVLARGATIQAARDLAAQAADSIELIQ